MIVLSLFDGISCGQVALQRANIPVSVYFASEIDKYAIQITQKNFPNTVQLGDVTKIDFSKLVGVDLVMGGSPCQDLSIAKNNRKGLEGERSGLFFCYLNALRIIKPRYFLLENVASMTKENQEIITNLLREIYPDTKCTLINSALVSAQNRKRLYWTNWDVEQPEDKLIYFNQIMQTDNLDRFYFTEKGYKSLEKIMERSKTKKLGFRDMIMQNPTCEKFYNLDANYHKGCDGKRSMIKDPINGKYRMATPLECERLQTLPDNYTEGVSNTQRYKCLGNGWTVDVIAHILRQMP